MPVDIRPFVEQQLDIQGELEVRYEDYSNGPARLRHFLKSEDRRIALDFKATPPRLPSGEKVAAHGVYLDIGNDPDVDGAMALNSGVNILTLAADGGEAAAATVALQDRCPTPSASNLQRYCW